MTISQNAQKVLENSYQKRDSKGNLRETPEELCHRVARTVARAEHHFANTTKAAEWEDEFRQVMSDLDFLPDSPTLMNADFIDGQLSAC